MSDEFAFSMVAVVAAYIDAGTIAELVKAVQVYAQVIVVDDGSFDATGELAQVAGAIVLRHAMNHGCDAALQSSLLEANQRGFSFVMTLDADCQHASQIIQDFAIEVARGADVVIGTREFYQCFFGRVFSFVALIFWNFLDPLCCKKSYRILYLSRLGFFDSYQSVGTEFVIRAT
jgi:glycosyltransferase involved in cell wall biosynthesis